MKKAKSKIIERNEILDSNRVFSQSDLSYSNITSELPEGILTERNI